MVEKRSYTVRAMLNNDRSCWRTMQVKAKNKLKALEKAEKRFAKIADVYTIESIEETE